MNKEKIITGGLYATKMEDGSFEVVKVLAVDDKAVHLRVYANCFKNLPRDIDPSILTLDPINNEEEFGIGHVPLAKEDFLQDNPIFLKKMPLLEEELEGYRFYLKDIQDPQ